jgi:hypothetical protein
MFVDVMQKAMDQTKDATVNVVFCLPFLCDVVTDMVISLSRFDVVKLKLC